MAKQQELKVLGRDELSKIGCDEPDCTHDNHPVIYLKAWCHDRGVDGRYDKLSGTLRLECAVCHKPFTLIKVAFSELALS